MTTETKVEKIIRNKPKSEYMRDYYQQNKEKFQERYKGYYADDEMRQRIIERSKERYGRLKNDLNNKVMCECGAYISLQFKPKHIKLKCHLNYIEMNKRHNEWIKQFGTKTTGKVEPNPAGCCGEQRPTETILQLSNEQERRPDTEPNGLAG
jgi:hypothetical protein